MTPGYTTEEAQAMYEALLEATSPTVIEHKYPRGMMWTVQPGGTVTVDVEFPSSLFGDIIAGTWGALEYRAVSRKRYQIRRKK